MSHSIRPFTSRIRCTPEIASRPDRIETDLANVKKLASILEDEATRLGRFKDEQQSGAGGVEVKVEHQESLKERGSEAIERRLERLVSDMQEQEHHQEGEESGLTIKKVKPILHTMLVNYAEPELYSKSVIALDLYLAYLRAAFNCCYYCAAVTDFAEELQRKCIKHVRKPLSEVDPSKGMESSFCAFGPFDTYLCR